MQKIIKYKAFDGVEFNVIGKCLKYENEAHHIKSIMARLADIPSNDGCSFGNGNGYIQQNEEIFMDVRLQLLKIAKKHIDHKWIQQSIDEGLSVHGSWVGRLISDLQYANPLNRAWCRILATDNEFREWGQIYYANHPDQGKQIKLNNE